MQNNEENRIHIDDSTHICQNLANEPQVQYSLFEEAPFTSPHESKFSFIDLFAGIGGFRLAAQSFGGECKFSSEWNKQAQVTYEANFGDIPYGDITLEAVKNNIPEKFNLLLGGFPCQPFSISGLKKGFEDTRGTLFFDICQILSKHQPECFILENVQHLKNHDKGKTLNVILNSLKNLGYKISYEVLNARDFGLPQSRERIFIVGSKSYIFDFSIMKKQKHSTIEEHLDKYGEFEYLHRDEYTILPATLTKRQEKSGLIFCGYRNKKTWKTGIRPNTEHLSRVHRQPNRIYSIKGVHPTLPSQESSGRFFIYDPAKDKVRKLTINECYRFMGFPANYIKNTIVSEQYKQLGNSVAIPVVKAIIESMIYQKILTLK